MALDINIGILTGVLADEPRIKLLPSGDAIAILRVGTTLYYKKEEKAAERAFVSVRVMDFGNNKQGAWCEGHRKGEVLTIQYRVYERTWEDKTGKKHWETVLDAQNVKWGSRGKPQVSIEEDANFGFGGQVVTEQSGDNFPPFSDGLPF